MFGRKHKTETDSVAAEPVPETPEISEKSQKKKPRPLLVRLFAVRFWGAMRLLAFSVVVGLIQQVGWSSRKENSFDALAALGLIWENTIKGALWLIVHGWKPALLGATVVLPIWVIWRLISLPFRK